jgi:hypothetical protein
MPFWKRKKTQEDQPEQGTAEKKDSPARGENNIVDKESELEKKIITNECQKELQQIDVLRRMRKDPSWDLAIKTLLLCKKNPSDAELIAASIHNNKIKHSSRFLSDKPD